MYPFTIFLHAQNNFSTGYWNEGNNEAKYAIDSNSSTGQYAPPLSIGKE